MLGEQGSEHGSGEHGPGQQDAPGQPGAAGQHERDTQPEPQTGDQPAAAAPADTRSGRAPLSGTTFLTVAEVATAMRVSKMTVYRLVHAGTLPAVQVGRSFRIPASAVDEYLDHAYVQAG